MSANTLFTVHRACPLTSTLTPRSVTIASRWVVQRRWSSGTSDELTRHQFKRSADTLELAQHSAQAVFAQHQLTVHFQ